MSNTHASSKAAIAARADHAHRTLFFALAAGLTIATFAFGLALVGGARAEEAAPIKVTPLNRSTIEAIGNSTTIDKTSRK